MIAAVLLSALVGVSMAQTAERQPVEQPNILFVLADDLGWSDVEWHDSNIVTPNLNDMCHNNAVELNQSYANMLCSMTRSALLTGYDAYHIGTHTQVIGHQEPVGIPLKFPFFGERMQQLGYGTYMVGKWHMGYCRREYLPTNRGFDRFTGMYLGDGDHFWNHWLGYSDAFGYEQRGYYMTKEENGESTIEWGANGTYSSEFYAKRMMEYVKDHVAATPDKPWIGFVSFQGVHCPLSAPQANIDKCTKITDPNRKVYCGMVNNLDDQVGYMIQQLKDMGQYDNTVIIFTSDNGGHDGYGARNMPLRGIKGQMWEGGMRGVNCVHYPKFTDYRVMNDLFHVTDWLPTFMGIGGSTITSYGDGYNQWDNIQGKSSTPKRNMLIYNISPTGAAMRWNNWKLIIGQPAQPLTLPIKPPKPQGWVDLDDEEDLDIKYSCKKKAAQRTENPAPEFPPDVTEFLFDLDADPLELNNLATSKPALVNRLKRILNQYMAQQVAPLTYEDNIDLRLNLKSNPEFYNNTWQSGWCSA